MLRLLVTPLVYFAAFGLLALISTLVSNYLVPLAFVLQPFTDGWEVWTTHLMVNTVGSFACGYGATYAASYVAPTRWRIATGGFWVAITALTALLTFLRTVGEAGYLWAGLGAGGLVVGAVTAVVTAVEDQELQGEKP